MPSDCQVWHSSTSGCYCSGAHTSNVTPFLPISPKPIAWFALEMSYICVVVFVFEVLAPLPVSSSQYGI